MTEKSNEPAGCFHQEVTKRSAVRIAWGYGLGVICYWWDVRD
jgi:hypothetical protein